MLAPRWRKVLADLWSNKVRTVLTVLSIAVGVQTVGTIATTNAIIGRDMDASYQSVNPAGGLMMTTPFGTDFVASLAHVPGVGRVEGRTRLGGYKVQLGEEPQRVLDLRAYADFYDIQLDRLILKEGAWPEAREMVIERASLSRLAVKIGDSVLLAQPDGKTRELRVAGIVEDRTADATAGSVLAYTRLDTLDYLGQPRVFNSVVYSAAERTGDREHVREVGRSIEDVFRRNGGVVAYNGVREPGRHPNSSQVGAISALLAVLSVLTVFLSGFLVINTVSALMAQQLRYIGVMKAVGARTGQILGMYLALLACLGLLAFIIAAPLGIWAGYQGAGMLSKTLNFVIAPMHPEPGPLALMAALSVATPLIAGLVPVRNGAATTIREAISGYGLRGSGGRRTPKAARESPKAAVRVREPLVSRPLTISLRNSVRRKGRLALTVATLTLAGAIFVGVMSTQGSMSASLTRMYRYYLADVNADFDRMHRVNDIKEMLADVPRIASVEGWIFSPAELLSTEPGAAGQPATDRLTIMAPPTDSTMVERSVQSGRWLLADDENAIVMCTTAMAAHPDWKLGSTVHLKLSGKAESDFVIVGTFPFASGEGNKIGMANYEYMAELLNLRGQASNYRIVTVPHDAATQDRIRDIVAERFKAQGSTFAVASGHTTADALGSALNIVVIFLLALSLLIALVGALGLMGMMGMNVMERTREIGVMRSIGASNGIVMQMVIVEGVLTGLLSWVCGGALGMPVGKLLSTVLGQGLFGTPFDFIMNWSGLLVWLAGIIVLSVLASVLPAWNASRLTVREVLAYE